MVFGIVIEVIVSDFNYLSHHLSPFDTACVSVLNKLSLEFTSLS
jgi:hypothetical protein